MLDTKILTEKEFIQKIFIDDIKRLQKHEFHYLSIILIGQAIETLGAFLDKKPLRARQQSKKRFNKAINVLFKPRYKFLNREDWLYDKLRNHMTHMFVPSAYLHLTFKDDPTLDKRHLDMDDKKLIIIAEDFHNDLIQACEKLFKMIDEGRIKPKKIEADFLNFGEKGISE